MINFQDKDGRWVSCFHIPKNGGATILYGIFGRGLANPDEGTFFDNNRKLHFGAYHYNDGHGEFADHFTYREAKRRGFVIHPHSIAIVRNPWKRTVSRYLYLRDKEKRIPAELSFTDWLINRPLADDGSEWRAGGWHQQYEYLIDDEGKMRISQVLRLEDINICDFFSELLGRNIPPIEINVTKKYDYKSFYTPELVDIVAQVYAKDIELFGYSYE